MPQQPIELILTRQWASYLAVPVWVMGENGHLLYYNESAEVILGRRFDEAGEMPGEELASIFKTTARDGSRLKSEELPINIALLKRRPATLRHRFRGLDGLWHLVDVAAFPIEGQGGRQLGAVAIFWEVTE